MNDYFMEFSAHVILMCNWVVSWAFVTSCAIIVLYLMMFFCC